MKEHANLVFQISDLNKVEELVSKHRKWRLQELEGIRRNKIVTKYGFRRKLRHWLRMRPFSRPRGCSIDYSSPPPAIIQELEALREIGQVKYLVQMYKQRLEDAISQDMQECRQRRTTRVAPSISRNRNLTPSDSGTRGASESSVRTILGSAFRNQLEQLLQGMVTRRQQVEGDTDATPEDFEGNQSLSATEVSYGSSTLQHLERKLEKLQRLLSTCIEMQSETHRAIRQEVSASLRSDSIYNAEGLVKHSKPFQSGKCTVCCDRNIDAVMYKCGHMVACYHCSREICDRGHTCPLCRAVILEVIKTYGATDS